MKELDYVFRDPREFLSDETTSTREYFEYICSMSPEEFEQHINKLRECEALWDYKSNMPKGSKTEVETLDSIAERAGGYVIPPWELKQDERGMRQFSAVRQYSLLHNKPISKLTRKDYRKIIRANKEIFSVAEYTPEEIKAIDRKMKNPQAVVLCPRCGAKLGYREAWSSCEVLCPTEGCLKGTLRGI